MIDSFKYVIKKKCLLIEDEELRDLLPTRHFDKPEGSYHGCPVRSDR